MLAAVQAQLEARFASLVVARKPLGTPVYALEHGLDAETLSSLAGAARTELWTSGPRDAHWLVWTALAAEAGYTYAGDEYWPALEALTADWRNNNNRTWLRRRFVRFHDRYRGPVPVGRWAEHFSIISWPIANAILPRYLQALFARRLYNLRHHLADIAHLGTAELGRLLCETYDGASPRFADFLQQTALTTQIVLALRDDDRGGDTVSRISPDLFQRIVSDLETRPESRSFLRAARKVISERRAHVGTRLLPASGAQRRATDSSAAVSRLRLAARRDSNGAALFGMIFPDVPAALSLAGLSMATLETVRMRLPASNWEPGEALLTFTRRDQRLPSLPFAGAPYIELSGATPGLHALLQPLLTLEERNCWVLRRHSDGLFRQVAQGHVRPGHSYLIAARTPLQGEIERAGLQPCSSRTDGVVAYQLEVGARFAAGQRDALTSLGIGSISTLRLDPLGYNPGIDADTALPVWHAGQAVLLRVAVGDAPTHVRVVLDDEPPERIETAQGVACFALEDLDLGRHEVAAVAERDGADSGDTARFTFVIAAPAPWPETMRQRSGFRLFATPVSASLEDVFSGAARLGVLGPAGRTIHWALETYDAEGHVAAGGEGGTTPVEADSAQVAAILSRLRTTYSDAIDVAHRIDIVAAAGDLGRQAVSFPHLVEPVRWVFNPVHRTARLIDETAHDAPIRVRRYPLATPLIKVEMAADLATVSFPIDPPGTLLIADYQGRQYSLFVSQPVSTSARSFAELAFAQDFAFPGTVPELLAHLVAAYRRWKGARPAGQLALVRKQTTLARLLDEIAGNACGNDFWSALRTLTTGSLQWAQGQVRGSPGFASRLRTQVLPDTMIDAQDGFIRDALHYGIDQDRARCGDAYLLAFAPDLIQLGSAAAAKQKMEDLLANRSLLRGAFLARAAAAGRDAGALSAVAQ